MFAFPPLFVTQNGIYKPHNAHLRNFTQKGGNICGFQETLNVFSGINFDAFSKVEQVENSKTNSPLLNFTRINSIWKIWKFLKVV